MITSARLGSSLALILAVGVCAQPTPVTAQPSAASPQAAAQAPAGSEGTPAPAINISDEPKSIPPAAVMSADLVRPVTVQFEKAPLRDVLKWLREEQKLNVLLDPDLRRTNAEIEDTPVSDRLADEPLYLLLDRLKSLRVGWYRDGALLFLTDSNQASEWRSMASYNVGNLLDAGVDSQRLMDAILQGTSGPWDVDEPGTGTIVLLGDVLFVRQDRRGQNEVAALLAALQKPGRRTLLLDLPGNAALRETQHRKLSIDFQDKPFADAIDYLVEELGVAIRLHGSVHDAGVQDEDPVSVVVTEGDLSSILRGFTPKCELTTIIEDGILWIGTTEFATEVRRTAVFDVRDLCTEEERGAALVDAIVSQTVGPWDMDEPGTGTIDFLKPGMLVVRQSASQLDAVLDLLESYRLALRTSKPRERHDSTPQGLVTRVYRVPTAMAADLEELIPQLVAPESWKVDLSLPGQPDGRIWKSSSLPEVQTLSSSACSDVRDPAAPGQGAGAAAPPAGANKPGETATPPTIVQTPYSVLIIRQTRENHRAVDELIRRIEKGDAREGAGTFCVSGPSFFGPAGQ